MRECSASFRSPSANRWWKGDRTAPRTAARSPGTVVCEEMGAPRVGARRRELFPRVWCGLLGAGVAPLVGGMQGWANGGVAAQALGAGDGRWDDAPGMQALGNVSPLTWSAALGAVVILGVVLVMCRRRLAKSQADRDKLAGLVSERGHDTEITSRLAAIVESSPDAIFSLNTEGRIQTWNRGAESIYGYQHDQIVGRDACVLLPPERVEECHTLLRRAMLGERIAMQEMIHQRQDGQAIHVSATFAPLKDKAGRGTGASVICRDITERKSLETQYLRTQRMEALGTLTGGIAHELNNILTPIMMSAPMLRWNLPPQEVESTLNIIEQNTARAAAIIRQLQTYGRGLPGERVLLQPRHLLCDMVAMAQSTFPKNIRFETDIPEDLGTLVGDPAQIQQVLLNLFVNARDAMPHGGLLRLEARNVTVDAAIAAQYQNARPGEYVRVRVTDSGTGISPAIIDKIFEPFFTTKGVGKGTGLGLSTVLGIVHAHQGFVHVQSEAGRGSVFEVYVPRAPGAMPVDKTPPPAAPSGGEGQGQWVLLVEDEADIRKATQAVLENAGYRILTAHDGAAALSLYMARKSDIQLVVTDLVMPVMDGIALTQALRQIQPGLRVLGASGIGEDTRLEEWRLLGVRAILRKPYDPARLVLAVQEGLAAQTAPVAD